MRETVSCAENLSYDIFIPIQPSQILLQMNIENRIIRMNVVFLHANIDWRIDFF